MNIRSLLLSFLTFAINTICTSQITTTDQFYNLYRGNRVTLAKAMKNDTLLVVIDSSNSQVGRQYTAVFNTIWKFNPVKFITPAEIPNYANSEKYSFFMFASAAAQMQAVPSSSTPNAVSTWASLSIDYGEIPEQSFNVPFIYGFFIGNKKFDKKKPLKYLDGVDYEVVSYDVLGRVYSGMNLRTIQMQSISCIPQIIKDLQIDLNLMVNENKILGFDEKNVKIKVVYEGNDISCKTGVYYWETSQKALKTKKILVDSSLADGISIQYLSELTEIDAGQIQLVSVQTINDAIAKKDENIYFVKERCSANPKLTGTMWRICNSSGKKIVDFPGMIVSVLSGSAFNMKNYKTFSVEIFNKTIDPAKRAAVKLEIAN